MPRRRPAQVRIPPWHGPHDHTSTIAGLPTRDLAELARLERTRNYLWPGAVAESLARWREIVHTPHRRLLVRYEGCGIWRCCGDPHEVRHLLECTMRALPRRSARRLRRMVTALDEQY